MTQTKTIPLFTPIHCFIVELFSRSLTTFVVFIILLVRRGRLSKKYCLSLQPVLK
jgi:hypothetical protein